MMKAILAACTLLVSAAPALADYPTPGQVRDPMNWMFNCSDDPCTIHNGQSGRLNDFLQAARDLPKYRKHGVRVPGMCNSGCIVFLDLVYRQNPNWVCILPGVNMSFHKMVTYPRAWDREDDYPWSFDRMTGVRPPPHRDPSMIRYTDPDLRHIIKKWVHARGGFRGPGLGWDDYQVAYYNDAKHWFRTCSR